MHRPSAETAYLCLAGVFGLFFAIVTPPFQSPDEPSHFLRAYQLSNLTIVGEKRGRASGGVLPAALFDEAHRFDDLPFHQGVRTSKAAVLDRLWHSPRMGSAALDQTSFVPFQNTVRYSPAPYVPEVIAMLLARGLGLTVVAALYLCRLFALAGAIVVTWASIRLLPAHLKWSLASLALLPMALFIVAMASPDALIIGLSFLVFSLAVRVRTIPPLAPIPRSIVWPGVLSAVALALSKTAYFLVPAALAIAFFTRLRTWRARLGVLVALIVVCLALDLAWLAAIESIRTPPREDPSLDPTAQLRLVMHDPMIFVRAAATDISGHALRYYDSLIGKLGWLDVVLPRWTILGFTGLLGLFACTRCREDEDVTFTVIERLLIAGIAPVTFVLTLFLQYLDWVPVGQPNLMGVLQGRHYIPVIPALLFVAPRFVLPAGWSRVRPWLLPMAYAALLTVTAVALLRRYYG